MNPLSDRRIQIAAGAVALVVAFLLVVGMLKGRHARPDGNTEAPPGLQLELGKADPKAAAKTQPVRCFVDGKLVGMTTLTECAQKNGTASQALDVGLDAAAPPAPANATDAGAASSAAPAVAQAPAQAAECLKFATEGWKGYGSPMALGACVRVLFQGQCARAGEAVYGRWGAQSLRLIPGRVEISDDNRHFRLLVEQDPQDCSVSSL